MKLKLGGKITLLAIFAVAAFFGLKWWMDRPIEVGQSQMIGKVTVPDTEEASFTGGTTARKLPFPSTTNAIGHSQKQGWPCKAQG